MASPRYRGYRFTVSDADDGKGHRIAFIDFPAIAAADDTVAGAWEKASKALDRHLDELARQGVPPPRPVPFEGVFAPLCASLCAAAAVTPAGIEGGFLTITRIRNGNYSRTQEQTIGEGISAKHGLEYTSDL